MKLSDKVFIIGSLSIFSIISIGMLYIEGVIPESIFSPLLYAGPIMLAFSMEILRINKSIRMVYIAVYLQIFSYFVTMIFIGYISNSFTQMFPDLQLITVLFLLSTLLYPVFNIYNNKVYLMFNKKEAFVKNPASNYNKFIRFLKLVSFSSYFIIIILMIFMIFVKS